MHLVEVLLKKEGKDKNRPLNLIYKHCPKIHPNFQAIYNFANVLSVSAVLFWGCFGLASVSLCSSCSINCLVYAGLFYFYHCCCHFFVSFPIFCVFLTSCQWITMLCAAQVLHNIKNLLKNTCVCFTRYTWEAQTIHSPSVLE